jgi:PPP family 3-phenylpropionic acid transporter
MYALGYACDPIYTYFLPLYLNHRGIDAATITALMSIGPFAALFGLPILGREGDRARTKNSVLKFVIITSTLTMLLYKVSSRVYYVFLITALFYFLKQPQHPLEDTIVLEYYEKRSNYGYIRLAGTAGYAIASVFIGASADIKIDNIFVLFLLFGFLNFVVVCFAPPVAGHGRTGRRKLSLSMLGEYKELTLYIALGTVMQLPVGVYVSSFPIYYTTALGGTSGMLGWLLLVAACSEIPFLLFQGKILSKVGTKKLLLFAAAASSIRWLLTYFVVDPYGQMAVQCLQGISFIIMHCAIVNYINTNVSDEYKASGQAMYALFTGNLARILGNVIGAVIIRAWSIRAAFLCFSIFTMSLIPVFAFMFHGKNHYTKSNA